MNFVFRYLKEIGDDTIHVRPELNKYYYENPDLWLLLNLLTETQGLGSSLRILSLFDARITSHFKATDVKITLAKQPIADEGEDAENIRFAVNVLFSDAPAKDGIFKHLKEDMKKTIMYTTELFPSMTNSTLKQPPKSVPNKDVFVSQIDDISKEYTVRVSTWVNGKVIAFEEVSFGPLRKKVP